MKNELVALVEDDVGEPDVLEITPPKECSLTLSEAQGTIGALTRARRSWILAKRLGVVFDELDEEAIKSLAKHLKTPTPSYTELHRGLLFYLKFLVWMSFDHVGFGVFVDVLWLDNF